MKQVVRDNDIGRFPAAFAWLGLTAVYLGFLTVGFVFHFLPPILPLVIADQGIGHGQAGLLMSLFALPGILLSLPGGWLVDRYGERAIGSLGLVVMGGGTLLLGLAPSFALILVARVISGVGAMIGVVALQRLVVRLFATRSLGLPLGVSGSAIPIGIVVVLNAAGPLAASEGWRAVALRVGAVTAVVGLVFAGVIWFVTQGRALGRPPGAADVAPVAPVVLYRPIWIAGAVWFCANGAMTSFMTFAPDHLQDLGLELSARGLVTSIPMWVSAALGMVTGWLTDRNGGRAQFMAAGMALMGAALFALPLAIVPPALIGLLLGLSLAAVVTPTIALPGALLPPSHTGRGYGMLATCANVGIFIVPPVTGIARDLSGGYLLPFFIMGGVALAGVVAADLLRRGRFMPGLSRRALLAATLLLAGCGSQDRYNVVQPTLNAAPTLATGQVTELRSFFDRYRVNAADAWAADDAVLVGDSGRAVRVQGDVSSSLGFSGDQELVGVQCEADGSLHVLTRTGEYWHRSAGAWLLEDQVDGGNLHLLARDHLGRALAISGSDENGISVRADGAWDPVPMDPHGRVRAVWSDPGEGTWLLTETGNILTLTDAGIAWTDSLTFPRGMWDFSLVGDGSGRLVAAAGSREMWLRENDVWTHRVWLDSFYPESLFWRDGVLHGMDGENLGFWTGTGWTELANMPGLGFPVAVEAFGSDHLIVGQSGTCAVFDGQTFAVTAGPQGAIRGIAEYQGRLLVSSEGGSLYEATDADLDSWHFLTSITTGGLGSYRQNSLAVDDRGVLIVLGSSRLWQWDGASLTPLVADTSVRSLSAQPGGEILVSSSSAVGSLRGGVLTMVPFSGFSGVNGVRRSGSGTLEVLSESAMWRVGNDGAVQLLWAAAGWDPIAISSLSPTHAFVLGRRGVRELQGDTMSDDTPYVMSGSLRSPIYLTDVIAVGPDLVLGWSPSTDGFLLRRDGVWHLVDPSTAPGRSVMRSMGESKLAATANHGIFLLGAGQVLRIGLDEVAP